MSLQQWKSIFARKSARLRGHNWSIEFDESIVPDNPQKDWLQYIRGAFARFYCYDCEREWASRRVLVVFHFQLNERTKKGRVKVRRFRQECRECWFPEMSEPEFEESGIEVVLEKLVEKIRIRCYMENLGETHRPFQPFEWQGNPHESDHCEACQRGFCRQSDY